MSRVEQALAEFSDSAVTVKLLRALYGAVPGAPAFTNYSNMEEAVRVIAPTANAAVATKARVIADTTDEIGDILWMANLLDMGDKGYAVMTGLSAAWKLFKGQGAAALENDSQQRNDAVLKGLGLAYMVYKAYPGSLADKARAFRESPSGQALAVYYGAVEVALPFADNAVSMGSGGLSSMLGAGANAQTQRLAQMAQGHDIGQAKEMLTQVTSQLQTVTAQAANYIQPITQAIGPYLPGASMLGTATDKAAGAIASAADVLPVYRYLAGRLAAEAAVRRALAT
jgi:hypothetical protein